MSLHKTLQKYYLLSWDYPFKIQYLQNHHPLLRSEGGNPQTDAAQLFSSNQFQRKRKSLVFFQSINFLCCQCSGHHIYDIAHRGPNVCPHDTLSFTTFFINSPPSCWLLVSVSPLCLTSQKYWARTFKCLWGPGIDAKEWIPPAYVVWRAGTKTLFLLGA